MKKSEYRDFFTGCKAFLKLGYFAEQCNIQKSRLSAFMSGYDYALSIDKLKMLYDCIFEELSAFQDVKIQIV